MLDVLSHALLLSIVNARERIRDEIRKISDAAASGSLARVQRRALKALGQDEAKLRQRVDERVKAIQEEDSAVFGSALEGASLDMAEIARLLEDEQHGRSVQGLADEVIHQITQLIQAFEDEIQRRQQTGGEGGGHPPPGAKAPLVPPIVEIKLLRRMQMDLNGMVETFWRLNPAVREGTIDERQRQACPERQPRASSTRPQAKMPVAMTRGNSLGP